MKRRQFRNPRKTPKAEQLSIYEDAHKIVYERALRERRSMVSVVSDIVREWKEKVAP